MTSQLSKAQFFNDWEARPHLTAEYRVNKQLSVAGTYYMYIDKNISTYDKSVLAGEVNYKFAKWFKAGFEHRYGITPKDNYHELRYSLTFSHKLSHKWKIKYRPMWQQEFSSLNKEKLAKQPMEHFLRNRITLGYNLTNMVELFVSTENYQEIEHGNWNFHRQKSAMGIKLDINPQNSIGTTMYLINTKKGKNIGRLDIGYTYTFGYHKK